MKMAPYLSASLVTFMIIRNREKNRAGVDIKATSFETLYIIKTFGEDFIALSHGDFYQH